MRPAGFFSPSLVLFQWIPRGTCYQTTSHVVRYCLTEKWVLTMCLGAILLILHLPKKNQKDFTIFREGNKRRKYKNKFSRLETAQCASPL